jgi:4-diphosphocytidyl-2C-methyl-D-erythritol kinase
MILFPPAKINFGLRVLHRREDGFHEIDSCMVAIPFFDVLEITPSDSFSFIHSGLEINGDEANNLVVKAYNLVASKFKRDFGVKDYSNIFPGHGGVMDRFDSVIFAGMVLVFISEVVGLL